MIQTKELRIGNNIEFDGEIITVIGISKNKITYNPSKVLKYEINAKHFDPIPLTEEILLKFGLKKIDDNLWQYKNGYLIGFYTKRWFIGKYNFDDMVEMITSFDYAHQLQNLYFALTREELILKTSHKK